MAASLQTASSLRSRLFSSSSAWCLRHLLLSSSAHSEAHQTDTLAFDEIQLSPEKPPTATAFILHGLLGSGRNWRSFSRTLASELRNRAPSDEWRMVLVDLRNHGRSAGINGIVPPHDMSTAAKDLADLVKTRGWAWPDVVVGHSMGGKVALDFVESCSRGVYGESAVLPKQLWVLDSVPGEVKTDNSDGEVEQVLQTLATLPSSLPSRKPDQGSNLYFFIARRGDGSPFALPLDAPPLPHPLLTSTRRPLLKRLHPSGPPWRVRLSSASMKDVQAWPRHAGPGKLLELQEDPQLGDLVRDWNFQPGIEFQQFIFNKHRWVVDHMLSLGFSKSLSEWIGSNLKKDNEHVTWAFDLQAAIDMFNSYRERDYWSLLEHPPKGLEIAIVQAERSDRWDPNDVQRLKALSRRECKPDAGKVSLHVLPNSGHWVHVDNPKGLLEIMVPNFLATVQN